MASIVSNTSLTLRDVLNMTIVEFEELLDGMNEYSEDMQRELKETDSNAKDKLEGTEAIDYLLKTFGTN